MGKSYYIHSVHTNTILEFFVLLYLTAEHKNNTAIHTNTKSHKLLNKTNKKEWSTLASS